jgi:hypothetical protein
MRDMTAKQFWSAVERHGMRSVGILGYVELGLEGRVSVSRFNGGATYRSQLDGFPLLRFFRQLARSLLLR